MNHDYKITIRDKIGGRVWVDHYAQVKSGEPAEKGLARMRDVDVEQLQEMEANGCFESRVETVGLVTTYQILCIEPSEE